MNRSAFEQYGASLRARSTTIQADLDEKFPMMVMPSATCLKMTQVRTHEDPLESGAVCKFHEYMGKAAFVSHQWLSARHPDPNFEQLRTLQMALENVMSGASRVSLLPAIELWFGRLKCPAAADFDAEKLYIWYDYFCIPQGRNADRQLAIGSIPSYISRCFFFLILSPAVKHEQGHRRSFKNLEQALLVQVGKGCSGPDPHRWLHYLCGDCFKARPGSATGWD